MCVKFVRADRRPVPCCSHDEGLQAVENERFGAATTLLLTPPPALLLLSPCLFSPPPWRDVRCCMRDACEWFRSSSISARRSAAPFSVSVCICEALSTLLSPPLLPLSFLLPSGGPLTAAAAAGSPTKSPLWSSDSPASGSGSKFRQASKLWMDSRLCRVSSGGRCPRSSSQRSGSRVPTGCSDIAALQPRSSAWLVSETRYSACGRGNISHIPAGGTQVIFPLPASHGVGTASSPVGGCCRRPTALSGSNAVEQLVLLNSGVCTTDSGGPCSWLGPAACAWATVPPQCYMQAPAASCCLPLLSLPRGSRGAPGTCQS